MRIVAVLWYFGNERGIKNSLAQYRDSANLEVVDTYRFGVPVEIDPTRMCERLVGLPDVNALCVVYKPGEPLKVLIEQRGNRPQCRGCGGYVVLRISVGCDGGR